MPADLTKDANRIYLRLSGDLSEDEHENWIAEFLNLIDHEKRWRLLVVLIDFEDLDENRLWEDTGLKDHHVNAVEKVGLAGDAENRPWMSRFSVPFKLAEIRFFDSSQVEEAKRWLEWSEIEEETD